MTLVKALGTLLLCCSVIGCASQPEQPQWVQQTGDAQSPSRNLQVQTTQGSTNITPTVVSYAPEQIDDPLESFNRGVFAFNHGLYTYVLNPLAKGYQFITPDPAERAIGRFFANLREPLNLLNNAGQGDGNGTARNLGRFLINSTLGLAGLFDPAQSWFGIEADVASINDTLRHYDVSHGAFIVIPVLGQSDLRNGFSRFTESVLHPAHVVFDDPTDTYVLGLNAVNEFAPRVQSYEKLYEQAEDPYAFFRDMYMQSLLRDEDAATQVTPNKAESGSINNE